MSTIYTLKNANFAGQGLPSIHPFVASGDAEFLFDFRPRASRLVDIAGRHTITPWRNDLAAAIRQADPTVVVDSADGKGIRVELGWLRLSKAHAAIPIDGSVQFSVLVVGGYSGVAFPGGKVVGSAPSIAGLFDWGTGINNFGFSFDDTTGSAGNRIKSGGVVNGTAHGSGGGRYFMLLTFDGTNWRLHNKTLGTLVAKTNGNLGIAAPVPVNSMEAFVAVGHYHTTSTISAFYPQLYQIAMWNRVLLQAEIDEQYVKTRAAFAGLSL